MGTRERYTFNYRAIVICLGDFLDNEWPLPLTLRPFTQNYIVESP